MTTPSGSNNHTTLPIGGCELTSLGASQFAQGNHSLRQALEIYIMTNSREFTNSQFIAWLRSVSYHFDQEVTNGSPPPGATGGHRNRTSAERSIMQHIGQDHTSGGSEATNPLLENIGRASNREIIRRLLESEEQNLPTRNTDWLRVRGIFQQAQVDVSVGSGVHKATASSQEGIGLAAPIGQQAVPLLPSEEVQSHLPELPNANPYNLDGAVTTSTSGFLYFIENPSFPGWIKVGRGSTVTRYEAYNTGDPHRGYRLIAETPVSGNLGELERELHILISQNATARGVSSASERLSEWFEIPVDMAISILVDRYPSAIIHSANW